jgi:hypothetical protein
MFVEQSPAPSENTVWVNGQWEIPKEMLLDTNIIIFNKKNNNYAIT